MVILVALYPCLAAGTVGGGHGDDTLLWYVGILSSEVVSGQSHVEETIFSAIGDSRRHSWEQETALQPRRDRRAHQQRSIPVERWMSRLHTVVRLRHL